MQRLGVRACAGPDQVAETIPFPLRTNRFHSKRLTVAVGTTIAGRPPTDPYERVYAYGSYDG
jgi:hypothetical protein